MNYQDQKNFHDRLYQESILLGGKPEIRVCRFQNNDVPEFLAELDRFEAISEDARIEVK